MKQYPYAFHVALDGNGINFCYVQFFGVRSIPRANA